MTQPEEAIFHVLLIYAYNQRGHNILLFLHKSNIRAEYPGLLIQESPTKN